MISKLYSKRRTGVSPVIRINLIATLHLFILLLSIILTYNYEIFSAVKNYSIEYIVLSVDLRKDEKKTTSFFLSYYPPPPKLTLTSKECVMALRGSEDNIEEMGMAGNDKRK